VVADVPYLLSHSLTATSGPHLRNHCSSPGREQTWAGLSSSASAKLLFKILCCQALCKADQNAKPEALGFHRGVLCQIQWNLCISLPCGNPCLQPACTVTSQGHFVLGGGRDTEGVPQKAPRGGKCTLLKTEGKQ